MNLYTFIQSMWPDANFWQGYNALICRYLALQRFDAVEHETTMNQIEQNVVDEETRRCFWYMKECDLGGSACARRAHFFACEEEWFSLLLPQPLDVFYTADPRDFAFTMTVGDFFDVDSGCGRIDKIGANGYMIILQSIFARYFYVD